LEGDVVRRTEKQAVCTEIEAILHHFCGEIDQVPPAFSAIKVNGERAYDLARAGEEVILQSRNVKVDWLKLIEHHDTENSSDFLIRCHKGTYIRSIARDMGISLGIYGHVTFLERVAVGNFHKDDAISLDKLLEMKDNAALETALLPLETPLDDIPAVIFDEKEAQSLKNGQLVMLDPAKHDLKAFEAIKDGLKESDGITALARTDKGPIGLIEVSDGQARPKRLFNL
ncbi:MAG: tRNA pseudouridine(55) synthase TruB, partial [Pseudobdellovibrionaceae bacterium]